MSVIEIDKLTKDYGNNKGVFDITINIEQGECFGYLGPNGAGKTTTIRHLMGFSAPDRGTCTIEGKNCRTKAALLMSNVGYLPGEISFPTGMTGIQFINMQLKMHKVQNRDYCKSLIKHFEVDTNCNIDDMSLGMRRKMAVVAAFLHDPKILILDEPTSGLDPVMQEVFIDFIKSEKHRGKTILLSSHIFEEVDACCDRVAIIKDGRIVDEFKDSELKASRNSEFLVTYVDGNAEKFSVAPTQVSDWISKMSSTEIADIREIPFSLEDYFMQFYKEDQEFAEV